VRTLLAEVIRWLYLDESLRRPRLGHDLAVEGLGLVAARLVEPDVPFRDDLAGPDRDGLLRPGAAEVLQLDHRGDPGRQVGQERSDCPLGHRLDRTDQFGRRTALEQPLDPTQGLVDLYGKQLVLDGPAEHHPDPEMSLLISSRERPAATMAWLSADVLQRHGADGDGRGGAVELADEPEGFRWSAVLHVIALDVPPVGEDRLVDRPRPVGRDIYRNGSKNQQEPIPVVYRFAPLTTAVILRYPAKLCNAVQRLAKTAGLV
jgi:hypothetical protein